MTDKEKILAEIESLLNETNYEPFTDEVFGKIQTLKELKSYISTMQEEPVSEELEEASYRFACKCHPLKTEYSTSSPNPEVIDAFKAGAKWQKEKDAILPHIRHRDTLDKFAYQCAYDLSNDWAKEAPEWKDIKTACKLGAQWQKEQMMVKAIDGEILEIEDDDCSMCSHTHLELCIESDILEKNGFKNNDKVKVIVIKED